MENKFCYFSTKTYVVGSLMDLWNETGLLKTKNTLFILLIRETSQFLCYERLLNMTYVAYKKAFFRELQFWSHCYTVVSYQALSRPSVYQIPAVYLSGAKNVCFCTIRDFGSPTNDKWIYAHDEVILHRMKYILHITTCFEFQISWYLDNTDNNDTCIGITNQVMHIAN